MNLSLELLFGLAVGALLGASIAVAWTRRVLHAKYMSLPTSAPPTAREQQRLGVAAGGVAAAPQVYGHHGGGLPPAHSPRRRKVGEDTPGAVTTLPSASKRGADKQPSFGFHQNSISSPQRTISASRSAGAGRSPADASDNESFVDATSGSDGEAGSTAEPRPNSRGQPGTTRERSQTSIQGVEDRRLPLPANGCGCEVDVSNPNIDKNDPIQKHYKKSGFAGAITGAFGDKKTMYCHHLTARNEFAVRAAANRCFKTEAEVWDFLGKAPCHGRFAYDRRSGKLKCGPLKQKDHDNTNNAETCLFSKFGLACPTPAWALKD